MTTALVDGLLSPHRILDLTNERGFPCGKFLGIPDEEFIQLIEEEVI